MPTDLADLRRACEGLLYPSESDSPIEVRELGSPEKSAREALSEDGTELEEVPFEKFFDEFLENDPSDERILALKGLLQARLDDLQVFRGRGVEVPIFVVGRDRAGRWIGLQTVSVET